ncbi:hypothetical protein BRADI_1g00535v3 [Brachypodium distachyon]|uniref:Uncharacterized protein n=1 Tax=Brachypodium distachyon TaxID=15368 RepID=A0A2K2DHI0_BRADI|nr:hypothetical protein BRADI_1g00535v3 [Brachypodium distachyon]
MHLLKWPVKLICMYVYKIEIPSDLIHVDISRWASYSCRSSRNLQGHVLITEIHAYG